VQAFYVSRRGKAVAGLQHPKETTWQKLGRRQ
jgi:hypothetical protein